MTVIPKDHGKTARVPELRSSPSFTLRPGAVPGRTTVSEPWTLAERVTPTQGCWGLGSSFNLDPWDKPGPRSKGAGSLRSEARAGSVSQ